MNKVYTWPDCPNCDALKEWLGKEGIEFEIESYTTAIQADFIMQDIFGSTPILETPRGVVIGEDLFDGHELNEGLVREYVSV